jgi:hypothetical protein
LYVLCNTIAVVGERSNPAEHTQRTFYIVLDMGYYNYVVHLF